MDHRPLVHIPELLNQIDGLNIPQTLQLLSDRFPGQVTLSTSFSFEDQVITHDILDNDILVSYLPWIPAACSPKPILFGQLSRNISGSAIILIAIFWKNISIKGPMPFMSL
jgi:hypothetical protein